MQWTRRFRRRDPASGLMRLDAALDALGDGGSKGRRVADVSLEQVVGTVCRQDDFDASFRPLRQHLVPRWRRLAEAVDRGLEPPPIDLVQLGELYFVADGHHRVSVARSMGKLVLTARVLEICTTAYAMGCLRLAHLPSKAAERQFLERVPLSDDVRTDLWLERPDDWSRLAEVAEAWGYRQILLRGAPMDRSELAATWWRDEVSPVLEQFRARGVGMDLRDVELYVTAMATREQRRVAHEPVERHRRHDHQPEKPSVER